MAIKYFVIKMKFQNYFGSKKRLETKGVNLINYLNNFSHSDIIYIILIMR